MKKVYIILLMTLCFLMLLNAYHSKVENTETAAEADRQSDDMPESDSLETWLGSYEQSGTIVDDIYGSFDLYIYREKGIYYGYLCVSWGESGTSCYIDERILTEIRGNKDRIQVIFLERQKLVQGCLHEEYPDIFANECGESRLKEAVRTYENQNVLFALKRDGDVCSVIEGTMILGKNQERVLNECNPCNRLTMNNICEEDRDVFFKMFRERAGISEKEQPDYSSYKNDGELILNLFLDLEQESGTGIYYGETQVSRYITQFDIDSWQHDVWEDSKFSVARAGETAATALDEYQEYREYNGQGQITSFYSEGIVTGWGEPQKEMLVEVKFFYRDDGTLEKKTWYFDHRLYGTTRQSETFHFDTQERLIYSTSYITYGMLSDYYFYEEGSEEPAFCLNLGHMGLDCIGSLIWYDNTYPDKALSSEEA